MAIYLKADGAVSEVAPEHGSTFSIGELQRYVGGYIEVVRVGGELFLVLDERGKLAGKSLNLLATITAQGYIGGDCIVGDALICRFAELESEDDYGP